MKHGSTWVGSRKYIIFRLWSWISSKVRLKFFPFIKSKLHHSIFSRRFHYILHYLTIFRCHSNSHIWWKIHSLTTFYRRSSLIRNSKSRNQVLQSICILFNFFLIDSECNRIILINNRLLNYNRIRLIGDIERKSRNLCLATFRTRQTSTLVYNFYTLLQAAYSSINIHIYLYSTICNSTFGIDCTRQGINL